VLPATLIPFREEAVLHILNWVQALLLAVVMACTVLSNGLTASEMGYGIFQAPGILAVCFLFVALYSPAGDFRARCWALIVESICLGLSLGYTGWSAYAWVRCARYDACRYDLRGFATANVIAYLLAAVQLVLTALLLYYVMPGSWERWLRRNNMLDRGGSDNDKVASVLGGHRRRQIMIRPTRTSQ